MICGGDGSARKARYSMYVVLRLIQNTQKTETKHQKLKGQCGLSESAGPFWKASM